MVRRDFRGGDDADASNGNVCFVVFHFLIIPCGSVRRVRTFSFHSVDPPVRKIGGLAGFALLQPARPLPYATSLHKPDFSPPLLQATSQFSVKSYCVNSILNPAIFLPIWLCWL